MKTPTVNPGPKSEREIFVAALDCPDLDCRQALLDRECGKTGALRDSVEALLSEHESVDRFLELPAAESKEPRSAHQEDLVGSQLGVFLLVRKIGEGGGGSVYLAEQSKPVRRVVALKILKAGLDGEDVISRFEAERQTLARMNHPHIASVIEAGATAEGRPYFVMEHVAGDPVTDFCREHQLGLQERLDLFIQISRAIEHAHQKGVIHRDLKPSNILVFEQEGQIVPKVIDFGVAKAIDSRGGHASGFTLHESIIGTPAYMSPEQASRDQDVDTRSDIYSLGVILYELLTGVTPLATSNPGITSTAELLKRLDHLIPPRPSVYREEHGPNNGVPGKFGRDLDWIILKCLETDRTRRFGSATELVQDLERYLGGAPILARPPSLGYRTGKFIARNRAALSAAAVFVFSLMAVAVLSIVYGLRAGEAEKREAVLRIAAEEDRELARKSAREARLHQYVANINLAQQALDNGNLSKAHLLLETWAGPSPGEPDPRGFEWWYLNQQCLGDPHLALPDFDSPVQALAFSPDAGTLAIGVQGHFYLWSMVSREVIDRFPRDARKIQFFPDGSHVITGGQEGITVFEFPSLEIKWNLSARTADFDLSPDGLRLAVGERDEVTIWDTRDWRRLRFFPETMGPVAFSPDCQSLATGSRDGITLWSLESDKPVTVLEESPRIGFGDRTIRFSKGGDLVLLPRNDSPTRRGFTVGVWEVQNGKEVSLLAPLSEQGLHRGVISASSLDRQKEHLVTSSWDHSVKLWDFEKGNLLRTFLGHRSEVWSVALSPDGRFIASGSKSGGVRIWPTAQQSKQEEIAGSWNPLAFSEDGTSLGASGSDGSFAIFDLGTGTLKKAFPSPHGSSPSWRPRAISVAKNLTLLAEAKGPGLVVIRDLKAEREKELKVGESGIRQVALSPDGRELVVVCGRNQMSWWDLESPGHPVTTGEATGVQFSSDGSTLVSLIENGPAIVWDTATRKERSRIRLSSGSRGSRVTLSPDGKTLAATRGFMDHENAITLWETVNGNPLGSLRGHKQGVWSIAFSADGKTIASSGGAGNIRLWNVETRSELLKIEGRSRAVSKILFSPDQRTLVVSSPGFVLKPGMTILRSHSTGEDAPANSHKGD